MRFVVLPGLDGTGRLLRDFSAQLRRFAPTDVVRYPPNVPLGYDDLVEFVRSRLPNGPFVLVGESFSGPIALRLASERPAGLAAVALAASFARLDIALKPALAAVIAVASPRLAPFAVLDWLLTGGRAEAPSRALFLETVRSVAPAVLRRRAREALAVDLGEARCSVPALYLRATEDRLMPKSAVASVARVAPVLDVVDVPGPHFVLQVEPKRCAEAIAAFASRPDITGVQAF